MWFDEVPLFLNIQRICKKVDGWRWVSLIFGYIIENDGLIWDQNIILEKKTCGGL